MGMPYYNRVESSKDELLRAAGWWRTRPPVRREADARAQMTDPFPLSCPYCGEAVELEVDETGGSRQAFVQDCPVCCRPWQVEVVRDREGGWNVTLRTADE